MKLNYGEALKYQREINNYTQSEVARKTGLKQQMISHWEANKSLPNIDFCVKLADFYGITVDELIGRDTIPNTKNAIIYNNSTHNGNNTF